MVIIWNLANVLSISLISRCQHYLYRITFKMNELREFNIKKLIFKPLLVNWFDRYENFKVN
jgi:hypothetical protein